jgi:hypothetical protein
MRTLLLCLLAACGSVANHPDAGAGSATTDADVCPRQCSADGHSVVDCHGAPVESCGDTQACDGTTLACTDACTAAQHDHSSVGCDYYATDMDVLTPTYCFAAFVANTWTSPAHINLEYKGQELSAAAFTRLPVGAGPSLTYAPYDPAAGLAPGDVAILFLGGDSGAAPDCPIPAANPTANLAYTGISDSFHITTDVPVVAYQINPYGGGSAAVTGASLLLPTSVWDTDYVALNVSPKSTISPGQPSLNIIAAADATTVTLTPVVAVQARNGIPAGAANQPMHILLNKGQEAQITQADELTGSVLTSDKPIGVMAGQKCMNMPVDTSACDHGEQMVPPVHALGSRYVGVMYRPRSASEASTFWRVVGTADGTQLSWTPDVGGPKTLNKGQVVMFQTGTPFVVASQDNDHPFVLGQYMTSSAFVTGGTGYGDPDFVLGVPPEQYLSRYVFFADPSYPETNLVIVRSRGSDGQFHDVSLDCAGTLTGWTPVGNDYEWTRTDLVTGNFANVGSCSTGRHQIHSDAPFGLWVWGWGTPDSTPVTKDVSYGYPAGMNVAHINDVIL